MTFAGDPDTGMGIRGNPAATSGSSAGGSSQPGLFDGQASATDAQFAAFHRDNPRVYEKLARLAKDAVARGRKKIGIRMLWEVMRWEFFLQTTDPDFKLNNNLTSRYARLLMLREPELAGIFEMRELKS